MSKYLLRGAELLNFTPHQAQIDLGNMLDQGVETNAILWPRRAGKSEGIWAWILGKLDLEPDFYVVVTGQTGSKARDRFLAAARKLDRTYPEDKGGPKIRRGAIVDMDWQNGSRLWVAPPDPDAFRGDYANVVWADEAMTYGVVKSADLKAAIPPLFDTVPDGQMILSGTAGKVREGWFWDALEAARKGVPGYQASIFALEDHEDPEDESLWEKMHPGLRYGLTTLDKMRARRATTPLAAWRMEYCSQWPLAYQNHALDVEAWAELEAPMGAKPQSFAIAYDLAPDNSAAAVTAAWRGADDTPHLEVLRADLGTSWVPKFLEALYKKHKCHIGYDKAVSNYEPATTLANRRPPVPTIGVPMATTAGAEARIDAAIRARALVHYGQVDLNKAVEGASWRDLGDSGRLWGRRSSEHNISPLVAGAVALHIFDSKRKQASYIPKAVTF